MRTLSRRASRVANVFATLGWKQLTRKSWKLQFTLVVLFLLCAINNVAAVWIRNSGEEHIYELLHRLQEQYGLASVMVSHDISFVFRYATKVLCLNRRSFCLGTPREALAPAVLEQLYGEPYSYYHHDHSTGPHDHVGEP